MVKVGILGSELYLAKGLRGGLAWVVHVTSLALAAQGFEVTIIAPRPPEFPQEIRYKNLNIITFPYVYQTSSFFKHIFSVFSFSKVVRRINADVFLSIDAMLETVLLNYLHPRSRHIIWAQNPLDWADYQVFGLVNPSYRISKARFLIGKYLLADAYKKSDMILVQAKYFAEKIQRMYGVDKSKIIYLPNPIDYIPPENKIIKSSQPLVCYLGRLDPEKRYWIFFELAKKFPHIQFIVMGEPSIFHQDLFRRIISGYSNLPNLKLLGFLQGKRKWEILDKCWILALPSIREGLPVAMLEALAHKCAILSSVNPDGLVERFGYYAKSDDFEEGLNWLLESDRWRQLGEEGYIYVKNTHSLNIVINKLIKIINSIL
jgi:glycosyltransferase involved in cell wall biosynthesis